MSNAHEILTKLWPIYYSDIAGSEDLTIASWDCPVYDHARHTIKALFEIQFPDIPAQFVYEQCIDCGEYLAEDEIRTRWIHSIKEYS